MVLNMKLKGKCPRGIQRLRCKQEVPHRKMEEHGRILMGRGVGKSKIHG
jgi:hypothetical protein